MKLRQSQFQKTEAENPSKLQFGEILLKRHKDIPTKVKKDILLSQIGEKGEVEVINEMKKYGKDHWQYFRNVWLDINGRIECDLIVVTNAHAYTFEVKNYDGTFIYEDGECSINGYDLPENCIAQANRSYKKLRNLCKQSHILCDVKGAIIFAGKYNPVEIKSPVNNIDVVEKSRLKEYIGHMISDEKHCRTRQFNLDKLVQQFDYYGIPDPFRFQALTDEEMKGIRTGICCGLCQSFDITINKKYVTCPCGFKEPREEAIIRTICEFGVLRYDKHLEKSALLEFFNGEISATYLYGILNTHFEKGSIGRRVFYLNKKLPFELIYEQFNIQSYKKINIDEKSLKILLKNVPSIEHLMSLLTDKNR